MTQVTLNILAKDIRSTNYINSYDCAITRALKRAGYPYLKDCGTDILNKHREPVINFDNSDYYSLSIKVNNMYNRKIPIEDFSVTLPLNI